VTALRRAAHVLAMALALGGGGCGPDTPAQDPASVPPPRLGQRVDFAYQTLDGAPLTTKTLAGRLSVIGFAATYDLPSQALARYLNGVSRRHTPRVNVALLVLEPEENRPLVEAFVRTLGLPYPVAFADAATIAGRGPFAGLHHVPSVVVLDGEGREAWRNVGLVDEDGIRAALRDVERRK
jgi:hypothetical protein